MDTIRVQLQTGRQSGGGGGILRYLFFNCSHGSCQLLEIKYNNNMSHMLCTGYFYKGGGGGYPPLKLSSYKDVFKGGSGGLIRPPPPEIFRFFLKSEGKEVEKIKRDGGRVNC